jgi:HEAT repeat protein
MRTLRLALLGLAAPVLTVQSQPLARRVSDVRDGEVRLAYAPRSGVCGDGREVIVYGSWFYVSPSIEGRGHSNVRCIDGPARVTLTLAGGAVTAVRTSVGGSWRSGSRATDLGLVPAAEAGTYFFGLANTLPGKAGKDALLAGVIADSTDAAQSLLRLARDDARPTDIRRRALHWLAAVGGADVVPAIDVLANDGRAPREVREAALSALAESDTEEGITRLIRLSSNSESWLARKAVFWLGQTTEERAHQHLRGIIERGPSDELRGEAIFALGHGEPTAEDGAFLRSVYSRLQSGGLKEKVIQSIAQIDEEGNLEWLLALARDDRESIEQRKKALFWAGQSDGPIAPLIKVYDQLREHELKEHAIFVLSQRDEDDAALDKLIDIARHDADRELRRKAIFWLGQSDDPRAQSLIRDLVTR